MKNTAYISKKLELFARQFYLAILNTDVNPNRITTDAAIQKNKGLLKRNTYTYLKPEQVYNTELNYKGLSGNRPLILDLDFYYTVYRVFMAQVEANAPRGSSADSSAYYLADRNRQTATVFEQITKQRCTTLGLD